jgi:mono/diheme cytochrome c family protein
MRRLFPIAAIALLSMPAGAVAEEKKAASEATLKAGGETFMRYCALCHGLDGTGLGPLSDALQKAPPDLTLISKRNGGTFPTEKIKNIIEHGGMASHGMMAMLAWGKVFNEEMGKDRQGEVINNLAAYLGSLQGR